MTKSSSTKSNQGNISSKIRMAAEHAARSVIDSLGNTAATYKTKVTDTVQLMGSTSRIDGWSNFLTGIGVKGIDKSRSSEFITDAPLEKKDLDRLYKYDGISKRIINRPVGDMIRKGFVIKISQTEDGENISDPAETNKMVAGIKNKLEQLNFKQEEKMALRMSRLYGGSIILMGIADRNGEDFESFSLPVDLESIQDIRWMKAIPKHKITVGEIEDNVTKDLWGKPRSYKIKIGDRDVTVHASRVLRFDGEYLSDEDIAANKGFGDSVLQSVFDALCDYSIAHVASAALVQDFSQPVFRMKGLADLIKSNGEEEVRMRVTIMDRVRSIIKMMLIDADSETFERVTTNVSGLDALLDRAMLRLSAASGLPMSLLFGMSPRGFANEDKSGRDNWNEFILAEQEDKLSGPIHKLVGYIMMSKLGPTKGQVPDSWSIEFESLEQPSDRERAELELIVAQKDNIIISNGTVSSSEVRNSRYTSEGFQLDTYIDHEARALIDEDELAALSEPENGSTDLG